MDYGREDETEVRQIVAPQFAGQLGGARPQTKGFAASTAEVTGENVRQIQRNVARAEAIGEGQKVLPRCFEHGGNAGAVKGSFSAPMGSCFDPGPRPRPPPHLLRPTRKTPPHRTSAAQFRDSEGNSRKTGFLGVSVKRMYAGQHGQDPGHSSRTAFPDKLVYGQFDGQTPKSRTAPRAAAGAKNKKASVVLAVAVVRFED